MRRLLALLLLLSPLAVSALEAPKVMGDQELRALTLESLLAFNQAVQAQDFTPFYAKISSTWRDQTTPEDLKTTFQAFIDQKIDLGEIAKVTPVLDPAKVDEEGVLLLTGSYPPSPYKVQFELRYFYEETGWKLLGINVDAKPPAAEDVQLPSPSETTSLVRDSLRAFNDAVQAKSFVKFHQGVAAMWQKEITPEKFQQLFQSFIDGKIDLTPYLGAAPTFDRPPAITDDGLLQCDGYFPHPETRVTFTLAYIFESPAWKLVKINVKVNDAPPAEEKPAGLPH